MGGADAPDGFDAAHPRHHEVHHDDVGSDLVDGLDRGLTAARLTDDVEVREARKHRSDAFAEEVVVVHDEYPDHVGRSGHEVTVTVSVVPSAPLSMSSEAPIASARSRMIRTPRWPLGT